VVEQSGRPFWLAASVTSGRAGCRRGGAAWALHYVGVDDPGTLRRGGRRATILMAHEPISS
jgi:hypothetical protein